MRRTKAKDAARLQAIFREPDVVRWWGTFTRSRIRRELIEGDEETVPLVIIVGGKVVGFIQFSEETDAEYRHAGLDIALHPEVHGRGFATDAIRTLARYLFSKRGHHRLVIDPAATNEKAVRAYEAAGFRRVGVMRRYERIDHGDWHDGLLMDLLEDELIPARGVERHGR